MKGTRMEDKRNGFKLKYKLLSAGLALLLAVVLANAVKAASDNSDDEVNNLLLFRQMTLLDPFTLKTIPIAIRDRSYREPSRNILLNDSSFRGQSQNILLTDLAGRPPIRIPFRPALRSPFRPPLF